MAGTVESLLRPLISKKNRDQGPERWVGARQAAWGMELGWGAGWSQDPAGGPVELVDPMSQFIPQI